MMPSDKEENERSEVNLELALNMLAETTTTEISKAKNPKGIKANREMAAQGGKIAGDAHKQIEAKTGKKVVSRLNAKSIKSLKEK